MNYFEHFDIPVSFDVDQNLLRKLFLSKSMDFHPDLNMGLDEDSSIDLAAYHNEAYKTLKSELLTIQHVLEIHNYPADNKPTSDFLMEMMEINETIEDAKISNDNELVKKLDDQLNEMASTLTLEWQSQKTKVIDQDLLDMANFYLYKMKYIRRMQKLLLGEQEI